MSISVFKMASMPSGTSNQKYTKPGIGVTDARTDRRNCDSNSASDVLQTRAKTLLTELNWYFRQSSSLGITSYYAKWTNKRPLTTFCHLQRIGPLTSVKFRIGRVGWRHVQHVRPNRDPHTLKAPKHAKENNLRFVIKSNRKMNKTTQKKVTQQSHKCHILGPLTHIHAVNWPTDRQQ